MKPRKHSRVNIRNTHPGLYHSITTVALMGLALGVNFWFSNPTFNPYDIPKNVIGFIFFALGVSQIVFLNVVRNLDMVRITLAVSIGWMTFWAIANTQQFFNGDASLQLPILYLTVALLQLPLLLEAPVNPMTQRASE